MRGKKPSLQKFSFSLLTNPYKNVSIIPADETAHNYISRSRAAWLARRAHNPEVVGSNPSSATKSDSSIDTIVSIEVSSFYRYFIAKI